MCWPNADVLVLYIVNNGLVIQTVSNSALGLLYGHDILTIYENLLL